MIRQRSTKKNTSATNRLENVRGRTREGTLTWPGVTYRPYMSHGLTLSQRHIRNMPEAWSVAWRVAVCGPKIKKSLQSNGVR